MAKKKRKKGLAAYKRAKKNTDIVTKSAKSNPPPIQDLMEFVVPGFAGYAGTRMTSRIVHGMVIKKWPKLAKHASVISTGLAAAGAWLLVHRVEKIQQYHTPVVVGASIAAIQTAVQAYLPKYGWMVSDHNINAQTAAQAALPSPAAQTTAAAKAAAIYNNSPQPETSNPSELLPIISLSSEQISDELDDLDMGSLGSSFDLDGMGGLSDYEMDAMIDDASIN
jgi:hypothetical protein